jgi:hypothetical protein
MRRTLKIVAGVTVLIGVTIGLSGLSGCGEEKKLPGPIDGSEPRSNNPRNSNIPTTSEDAAKRVVDRAIRAMTDNHPERLDKTKVNKSTAKGHYFKPVNGQFQFVETNRLFQAVYPDRVRVDYEFKGEGGRTNSIGLRRPAGAWFRDSAAPSPIQDPQQFAELVNVDAIGTLWLLTLAPMAEGKAVAFDFAPASSDGRPFDTVKVGIPGYPIAFTLWFDQSSALLTRVEYNHLEAAVRVMKRVDLAEHKPFGGLKLPTQIIYTRDGKEAERWTVESWEFPDTIDDAVFAEPK